MIKKLFIAISMVVLVSSYIGVGNVQAGSQKVDINKAEEVKRLVNRAVFGLDFEGVKLTYGNISYEKDENKIIISDVLWQNKKSALSFKKIEVLNYEEDLEDKKYSFDKSTASIGLFHNKAKTEGDKPTNNKLVYYSLSGVKGSGKKHTLVIRKLELKVDGEQLKTEGLGGLTRAHDIRLINIDKLQVAVLETLLNKAANGKVSPDKLMSTFEILSESLTIEKILFTNFPKFPMKEGGSLALEKITVNDFSFKNIGEVLLENLKVFIPEIKHATGKVDRIAFTDIRLLDIAKFGKYASENPGVKPTPVQAFGMLKWLGGFSVDGVDIRTPDGDFAGDYALTWGKYVGLFPTEINLDLNASAPVPSEKLIDPRSPTAGVQKQVLDIVNEVGMKKIAAKVKLRVKWDEGNQRILISPFIYNLGKLYSMSIEASIGNVGKAVLEETDPKKMSILLLGATVGPITLEVKDKGIQLFYDRLAKGTLDQLAADVGIPELEPVIANVLKLLNEPNGKFKIVVQPKSTVGLAQLVGAVAVSPASIISLFDIKSEYNKQ